MGRCPACGKELKVSQPVAIDSDDGSMEFRAPKPGDVTICSKCLAFLKIGPDMVVTELTVDDVMALPDNERITLDNLRRQLEKKMGQRDQAIETVRLVAQSSLDVVQAAGNKEQLDKLMLGAVATFSRVLMRFARDIEGVEGLKVSVGLNLMMEYFLAGGDRVKLLAALEGDVKDANS